MNCPLVDLQSNPLKVHLNDHNCAYLIILPFNLIISFSYYIFILFVCTGVLLLCVNTFSLLNQLKRLGLRAVSLCEDSVISPFFCKRWCCVCHMAIVWGVTQNFTKPLTVQLNWSASLSGQVVHFIQSAWELPYIHLWVSCQTCLLSYCRTKCLVWRKRSWGTRMKNTIFII